MTDKEQIRLLREALTIADGVLELILINSSCHDASKLAIDNIGTVRKALSATAVSDQVGAGEREIPPFIQHLQRCTEEVETWPNWKRSAKQTDEAASEMPKDCFLAFESWKIDQPIYDFSSRKYSTLEDNSKIIFTAGWQARAASPIPSQTVEQSRTVAWKLSFSAHGDGHTCITDDIAYVEKMVSRGIANIISEYFSVPVSPSVEAVSVIRRKAFICTSCEGVYSDQPVTSCDCLPEENKFIEGEIIYAAPLPEAGRDE